MSDRPDGASRSPPSPPEITRVGRRARAGPSPSMIADRPGAPPRRRCTVVSHFRRWVCRFWRGPAPFNPCASPVTFNHITGPRAPPASDDHEAVAFLGRIGRVMIAVSVPPTALSAAHGTETVIMTSPGASARSPLLVRGRRDHRDVPVWLPMATKMRRWAGRALPIRGSAAQAVKIAESVSSPCSLGAKVHGGFTLSVIMARAASPAR